MGSIFKEDIEQQTENLHDNILTIIFMKNIVYYEVLTEKYFQ